MSKLTTLSAFYYGINITRENNALNFDDGSGQLTAYVPIGDYSLSEIPDAVEDAMNLIGNQEYTITVNRTTRKITINGSSNFSLLCNSGSQAGTSIFEMLGFDTASDKTGSNSYTSEDGCGSEYLNQIILDDYTKPEDYAVKENAVVNISTSGVIQSLQFGDGARMACNIKGVSDKVGTKNYNYYENASGISDFRDFMNYLITKGKIEFMPDKSDRNTYYKLTLESTSADKNGTAFKIMNMKGASDYLESGPLLFRKVIE